MQAQIPFTGFYYSTHSDHFDAYAENENDELSDLYYNEIYDLINWKNVFETYCKIAYIPAFIDILEDETEISINESDIVFTELVAPREYNYTTDKIIVEINEQLVTKLYNFMISDPERLSIFSQSVKKYFQPRSGFIPFYSDNPNEWLVKPIDQWDQIELWMLLSALITENVENIGVYPKALLFLELCNGEVEECIESGLSDDGEALWEEYWQLIRESD